MKRPLSAPILIVLLLVFLGLSAWWLSSSWPQRIYIFWAQSAVGTFLFQKVMQNLSPNK